MMQIINDAINHSNNSIPCIKTVVQYENIATPFWGKNYTGPSSSMETIEKQALGVVLKKAVLNFLKYCLETICNGVFSQQSGLLQTEL